MNDNSIPPLKGHKHRNEDVTFKLVKQRWFFQKTYSNIHDTLRSNISISSTGSLFPPAMLVLGR